jgi:hypothetical protein
MSCKKYKPLIVISGLYLCLLSIKDLGIKINRLESTSKQVIAFLADNFLAESETPNSTISLEYLPGAHKKTFTAQAYVPPVQQEFTWSVTMNTTTGTPGSDNDKERCHYRVCGDAYPYGRYMGSERYNGR